MSRLTRAAQIIRQNLDWQTVFLENAGQIHVRCPNREAHRNGDRTPSCAVYEDHAHCYGCGKHWRDPIQFYSDLHGTDFRASVIALWRSLRATPPRTPLSSADSSPVVDASLVEEWKAALQPEHLAWLWERYRINESVAYTSGLGFTGSAISFPHYDWLGQVRQVKFRRYDPLYSGGLRWWGLKRHRPTAPYPAWASHFYLMHPPEDLVLCEGETDTLSALSNDLHAVGVAEGAKSDIFASSEWYRFWERMREAGTFVWVAYDNDPPGQQAASCIVEKLTGFGIVADVAVLPEGIKDVSELFVAQAGTSWEAG